MEVAQSSKVRQWFLWGAFGACSLHLVLSFTIPHEMTTLRFVVLGLLAILIAFAFLLLKATKFTLPDENPTLYLVGSSCWGVIAVMFLLGALK